MKRSDLIRLHVPCMAFYLGISFLLGSATLFAADPLDWTYWRGPEFNGSSRETGLPSSWDLRGGEGSHVVWKRDDLGTRSTPIVMNGKLYSLCRAEPETPREGERVVCLDAMTGATIWENRFNVWLSDVPDTRVGWSSVTGDTETGNVYALGVCGYFQCLNGETGEQVWGLPLHERFGLLSTYGGRTNVPVIVDDLVIISAIVIGWGDMAKPAHRFIAFDKNTGEVVWFTGTRLLPYDTTYSSPTVTVLGGQKVIVFGSGDGGVWALQARTGRPVWNYRFSRRGLNVSPLVAGERVFTGHSEENIEGNLMGAVAAINALGSGDVTKSGELWKVDELMMGKSSPLLIEDRLYCFDDRGKLHVLEADTGVAVGRPISIGGTALRSSPLLADGRIYAFTTSAYAIFEPHQRRGAKITKKGRLPRGEEVYASPIVSHGRLYLTTTGGIYCLHDATQEQSFEPLPEPVVEPPVVEDEKVAWVQVVPAEILTKPDAVHQFTVNLFNERGQYLATAEDAEFSLEGPGEISAGGKYSATGISSQAATIVKVSYAGMQGRSRIRIVPDLPWTIDFDSAETLPVTWVGARYRHVLREVDGSNAMVKITTIPKGARSRCWFGHSDLSNYTIQADVRGAFQNGKLPDIGLIAQGYTMDLKGEYQQLEIRTWVTQRRMARTVDLKWEANTWYTVKFQAAIEDDGNGSPIAVLRGKVWPRDEDEPTAWQLEAIDEVPNLTGSPGLFGNAKDAEITLDNIKVVANEE